jgi:hypothetical protein
MPYLIVNRNGAYALKLPEREPRSRGHGNPTTPGPRLSAKVRLMQINAALRHASTIGTSRVQ